MALCIEYCIRRKQNLNKLHMKVPKKSGLDFTSTYKTLCFILGRLVL